MNTFKHISKNRKYQQGNRRCKEILNGNSRTKTYNNLNKNSLDGLNSRMEMTRKELVNFKIGQQKLFN